MENILVSACLIGERCRYDGKTKINEDVLKLREKYNLIAFCPECAGGLSVPRLPSERCGDKVINEIGEDVTRNFTDWAEKALEVALENNCRKAVLKERSPSCGSGEIYDGSFRKILKNGDGVTSELLKKHGIKVFGESETEEIL